jgi:hypothetical protein
MKIIVTHNSPDMDAITSVWLIKRFLPGWENAEVRFVQAGERIQRLVNQRLASGSKPQKLNAKRYALNAIETIGDDEVIHVDTGLGPLDHHQTASDKVCAASLTWDFVRRRKTENRGQRSEDGRQKTKKEKDREEAIERIVKVVVDVDHFKEVFWEDATADYHELSLGSILDGLKLQKPNQDEYYIEFVMMCLDAVLHEFENKIWAEEEIAKNGIKFDTRFGKGIGFETINDSVIKLAQKMGYVIVVRKDPRKGYVRVKAKPSRKRLVSQRLASSSKPQKLNAKRYALNANIDLTLAYERLKKMDPTATWFLHVGKKMLLNGSAKNPKMRPTRLGLEEIIGVLKEI